MQQKGEHQVILINETFINIDLQPASDLDVKALIVD